MLASGVLGAWARLPGPDALVTTGYGVLLLARSALLLALAAAGLRHRRRALPALRAGRAGVARLAVSEGAVMAVALGLATALSRTPL